MRDFLRNLIRKLQVAFDRQWASVWGLLAPALSPICEQLGQLGHELLLPSSHLARADPELARQLGRHPGTPGGRQGHLRLEGRPKYSPSRVTAISRK
jgi:hypothetical protein